jgi:hypothetical protein
MEVCILLIYRKICKPALKLDFTVHDEIRLEIWTLNGHIRKWKHSVPLLNLIPHDDA